MVQLGLSMDSTATAIDLEDGLAVLASRGGRHAR
jgi:hypothetical protein